MRGESDDWNRNGNMWKQRKNFWRTTRKRNQKHSIILYPRRVSITCIQTMQAPAKLTGRIIPKSPCRASVGCKNALYMPRLFMVASILRPIFPLFPTPQTTSFPPSRTLCEICSTARASSCCASGSVWYRRSRYASAARSVDMT